ncbi:MULTISPECIES: hypothetical protein [unclassified Kitasatospora]|uniref:hypothetical protein n=1 Tax=unclassified Kitasatospora TaxID=2633591 RepID=UPI002476A78D|nr:hypothetical protein [Kitasatospora sp. GAS204B]
MRLIALAGYGFFVLAAGLTVMTHGSVQQRWGVGDLLPRLVLGIAASNLSLTLCGTMSMIANAITAAILGDGVSANDVAGTMIGLFLANLSGTAAPYMLVFQLVALTLAAVLVVTVLVRTAAIIVLTVASPLMLACHAHPVSDGIARLWWRAYLGCLGTEIAQAVTFLVCVKALLDPDNYGLVPNVSARPLINLMLICCTLYLLIKIPSWIRRIVTTPARTITGSMAGPRMPGIRILRKIAIGAALGMPLGPYAFGARLAGRFHAARGAARAASTTGGAATGGPSGAPRGGGPGPGGPGGPGGGPGAGRPGPGRGGPRPGGTPPASGSPGTAGGSGPSAGPSAGAAPSYQWGQPRRNAPSNQMTTPNPPPGSALPSGSATTPGSRSGPTGPQPNPGNPSSQSPKPGTGTGRTVPPPPAVRPAAATNLRPARANLPPPIPRPAPLRPPLDDDGDDGRRKRS